MKFSSLVKIFVSRVSVVYNYHRDIIRYGRKETILVNYFKGVPNWGDDLNEYLIEKVSGKKVVIYPYNSRQHVLGIGSVLHRANNNSLVWGSGFISENSVTKKSLDIRLLRGPLTAEKLSSNCNKFGDPGVCIRKYYNPIITKKYKYGFVPHHVDKASEFIKIVSELKDVLIIDIQQDIEPFIDELLSCENILSSSLHGLIASDSYGIPNAHIVISDKLLGGQFKFDDYSLGICGEKRTPILVDDKNIDFALYEKHCYSNDISDAKINEIVSLFPLAI